MFQNLAAKHLLKTWDMIRKINDKVLSRVNHLTVDSPKEIVDALATAFKRKSSSGNYLENIQAYKRRKGKKKLNFSFKNQEKYNKLVFLLKNLNLPLTRQTIVHLGQSSLPIS